LFSLRPAESFTRKAGNRGLHVNKGIEHGWDALKVKATENDLVYLEQFFSGYRSGVVANGTRRPSPDRE
jgi:hypothetical protein